MALSFSAAAACSHRLDKTGLAQLAGVPSSSGLPASCKCHGTVSGLAASSTLNSSSTLQKMQLPPYCNGYAALPCLGNACWQQHARPPSLARPFPVDTKSKIGFTAIKCMATVAEKALSSAEASNPQAELQAMQYHFLVANAKFMLDDEEHFQEVLRERLRNYSEKNKKQDFWLVIEPKFLEDFPDITKRVKRPAVALISTDPTWITFMKLRLDRVLKGAYQADTLAAALASNRVDLKLEQSDEWTAPYPKYETGWWTTFLPPHDLQ